jgi:2-polyprenyl-3-methyl-5-hydroxy-6-metoxy-1,4-benzoquinol methylase
MAPFHVDRRGATTLVVSAMPGTPEPADWPGVLGRMMDRFPHRSVVCAKRITPERTLTSMGEFVAHPKGLHSLGHGLDASSFRFPEEVDGVLAGAALFPTELVDGLDEPRGALGLLHWCLEARLRGGRVVVVPDVVWIAPEQPIHLPLEDLQSFAERFGFAPFAPDIDAILERPELAPFRWNVRHWGSTQAFEKYVDRGAFHWSAYGENPHFRSRADFLVKIASEAFAQGPPGPVLDVGCGDGLYSQMLAERGLAVLGLDDDETAITEAIGATKDRPAAAHFLRGSVYALPAKPGSVRGVLLLDVLEHLHNPSRALAELARVLAPGGALVVSTPEWQHGGSSDPIYHAFEWTGPELHRLLAAQGFFRIEKTARIGGVYRDLVVVARRIG